MSFTEKQFQAVETVITRALQTSKRGTPERDAADALSQEWERIYALPTRTQKDLQNRNEAAAAFAVANGLVTL